MKNNVFVHESSFVDEPCDIGAGTKIWHFSHIMKNCIIGENCVLGQNVNVADNVRIGNNCKIQNNVSIYSGVTLEDYVFCGPSMVFTNDINPRCEFPKHGNYKTTLVQKGATIGANATIICGHSIGKYAMVGAGAVVTKDVGDYELVVGNPAKVIGHVCRCGEKISVIKDEGYYCACGRNYISKKNTLIERE